MRVFFILSFTLLFTLSCHNRANMMSLNVDYSEKNRFNLPVTEYTPKATTHTMIVAPPVLFDGTQVLIQPCGLINENDEENMKEYEFSGSKKEISDEAGFYVEGILENTLSGRMSNLYFDDMSTNKKRLLTDNNIYIYTATYLRGIAEKTDKHYLMYSIYDTDSNKDGKIDSNDIVSMYISKLGGSDFKKITAENHEFLGGKLILPAKRCYYSTLKYKENEIEFSGKKGEYYYYYIDFSSDPYKVIEYNPTLN